MRIDDRAKLRNGIGVPVLGFGTFRLEPGAQTYNSVREALSAGYRHIDTARLYGNEADVGRAVRDSGLKRDEVFVTTKVQNSDQGRHRTIRAFLESDKALDIGPVDLLLMHWPVPVLRKETWKAMEDLHREGLCRAIGVSNFTVGHIKQLIDDCEVVPMVNQVELHPFLAQNELVAFCNDNDILVEAYSPLTRGRMFGDPRLIEMADAHGKSPAQILIRYLLQMGTVPLPSSKDPARIRENADVFDFSLNDLEMKSMKLWDMGLRVSWDPTKVP